MLGGAYSTQYKNIERQHVDTIKTLVENEKSDSIARAKKLSVETNRRRRALAVKRKSEAEKEEKRRQQILSRRRERQKDATERFQRAHMPPRSNTGSPAGRWSPQRLNTQLEDALRAVRGSPTHLRTSSARNHDRASPTRSYYRQNSDPPRKPYFNKYAHPSVNQPQNGQDKCDDLHNKSLRNLNNSRSLFEQQLESHQNSLVDKQHKALHDFNQQIMKEIQIDYNVVNGNQLNNETERERSESLSSLDSLETGSNDTLKASCDLDTFMEKKNNENNSNMKNKNVSFNENNLDGKLTNQGINSRGSSAGSIRTQNANSYNVANAQQKTPEQKQQFYQQRQLEIQQQLQEQQQQKLLLQEKQQTELQQRVLEQQQKQQFLLQQQYQKQQQEQMERQRQEQFEKQNIQNLERQQEEMKKQKQEQLERDELEKLKQQEMERQKHEQLEKQKQEQLAKQELYERQKKEQIDRQKLQNYSQQQQNTNTALIYDNTMLEKDKPRPKADMKAWATPSPHPPDPNTTAQTLVTHASPYTGKSTHTNVTTTVNTYKKQGYGDPNVTGDISGHSDLIKQVAGANEADYTQTTSLSNGHRSDAKSVPGDKTVSFLETVTDGLTPTKQTVNNVQANKGVSASNASQTNKASKTPVLNTSASSSRPVVHSGPYISSYSKAYSANKAGQGNAEVPASTAVTAVDNSRLGGGIAPQSGGGIAPPSGSLAQGTLSFIDGQLVMLPAETDDGQDTADTDSISTIQEEREPEPPKEPKSILKRPPSKRSGILKRVGSAGSVNRQDIRDSLEITRVHLQTSADEKQQRMIRELERSQVSKKNVRFADLCYDNEPDQNMVEEESEKLFVRRNTGTLNHKPPRPASAVTPKNGGSSSSRTDNKPPRASSATVRTSSIPRAKTQIVRPQAAAHIIAQGSQFSGNEDKKVTIVNNNFMEKVARANQMVHTATPTSVFSVTGMNYTRAGDQKTNYAVSSIVMPKSSSTASAPFIYPNYVKQDQAPVGSSNLPVQAGHGTQAVYDENGLRIDRTPTDDEINFLWDKVRTCLSRNSQTTPTVQASLSVTADGRQSLARQAAPLKQTYIDGNALGQYSNLTTRVGNQQVQSAATRRQTTMDSAGGSYTKRYGLLQQRKQQPNPNSLKSRQASQQQQGYTVYHAPVQSNTEPQPTGALQNGQDGVTESMAGFLAAEQLAEQSVSESRINDAMEQAQLQQQAHNAARPQPKVKSALSVEEQRLLESLDRLNDKLRVTEATIANGASASGPPAEQPAPQPQQHHIHQHIVHNGVEQQAADAMGGFQGHRPLTAQRRVIETANHKARLRITSAALHRNIHRNQ